MEYICKPTKIKIYVNTANKTMAQVKAETGCDAIINGGLFEGKPYKPCRALKVDGKELMSNWEGRWGLGCDENRVGCDKWSSTFKNFICCVMLVRDGRPEPTLDYTKQMAGVRQRTAFGVFPDGRVWMYATHTPTTPEQLLQIALDVGVKHALMLDGGLSTQCIVPYGTLTSTRKVHNFICVWTEDVPKKDEAPKNDVSEKKSLDVIAREVIAGKWGTGQKRKEALTKAGYNYNDVQKKVNELLK